MCFQKRFAKLHNIWLIENLKTANMVKSANLPQV